MAIKIGIVNQKGGVGKTTTAICLTDALTRIGYRTLLVDFAPQGNCSSTFGVKGQEPNIYDAIMQKTDIRDVVVKGNDMGDIVPSGEPLKAALTELVNVKAGEYRLRRALAPIEDQYDMIVIDSDPAPGIMLDNVLAAVDGVIVPMRAEMYSIDGIGSLIKDINEAKNELNPQLKIYGVLLTMLKDSATHKKISEDFNRLSQYNLYPFKTRIRHSDAISSTQTWVSIDEPKNYSEQRILEAKGSIYKYDNNSGATDYSNFVRELLEVITSE
ncbi:ParA family protein [Butyrivibrio hungatei]|uniref:Partitioning protein ParA n=1 Tax=Butyrivibrio hungatei TaxID=185008 RepID=A0A1D9P5E3_9FIRM|nr:AAA family ATPase [Butyrivibrio hungatei]AOZ97808.1 partitioning protein ParA [Butyrivibrio hungatei]